MTNEHQWEIRRERGYREFASCEADLRAFLAARAWAFEEGPRALFDRAVLWLVEHRVPLPRITVLARLVAEVRSVEHERSYRLLADVPTPEQHEGSRSCWWWRRTRAGRALISSGPPA